MSQGVAVEIRKQFEDLRRRLESESSVKGRAIALSYPEDGAWVYNLVTKQRCWEKPTIRDIHDILVLMRDHAIRNQVLEIHMPKIACGLDGHDWEEMRTVLRLVFREFPLKITVYHSDAAR